MFWNTYQRRHMQARQGSNSSYNTFSRLDDLGSFHIYIVLHTLCRSSSTFLHCSCIESRHDTITLVKKEMLKRNNNRSSVCLTLGNCITMYGWRETITSKTLKYSKCCIPIRVWMRIFRFRNANTKRLSRHLPPATTYTSNTNLSIPIQHVLK